jgi:hypothetical protein
MEENEFETVDLVMIIDPGFSVRPTFILSFARRLLEYFF